MTVKCEITYKIKPAGWAGRISLSLAFLRGACGFLFGRECRLKIGARFADLQEAQESETDQESKRKFSK